MSECQCSIEDDSDMSCDFISQKDRVAKKSHKCCECKREIKPGEKYRYECGSWEGDFHTYKTCVDCLSIRDTFFCGFKFTYLYETFREAAWENEGKFSPDCIALLTPRAKEKVLSVIREIRRDIRENQL